MFGKYNSKTEIADSLNLMTIGTDIKLRFPFWLSSKLKKYYRTIINQNLKEVIVLKHLVTETHASGPKL